MRAAPLGVDKSIPLVHFCLLGSSGLPVIDAKETRNVLAQNDCPTLARSWQKRRSKTASVAKCQLGTAVPAST